MDGDVVVILVGGLDAHHGVAVHNQFRAGGAHQHDSSFFKRGGVEVGGDAAAAAQHTVVARHVARRVFGDGLQLFKGYARIQQELDVVGRVIGGLFDELAIHFGLILVKGVDILVERLDVVLHAVFPLQLGAGGLDIALRTGGGAAKHLHLFHKDHVGAKAGGLQRGRQTRDAGADNHHVGLVFLGHGIALLNGAALPFGHVAARLGNDVCHGGKEARGGNRGARDAVDAQTLLCYHFLRQQVKRHAADGRGVAVLAHFHGRQLAVLESGRKRHGVQADAGTVVGGGGGGVDAVGDDRGGFFFPARLRKRSIGGLKHRVGGDGCSGHDVDAGSLRVHNGLCHRRQRRTADSGRFIHAGGFDGRDGGFIYRYRYGYGAAKALGCAFIGARRIGC